MEIASPMQNTLHQSVIATTVPRPATMDRVMQILKRGLKESLAAQRHSRTRSSSLSMEYSVT